MVLRVTLCWRTMSGHTKSGFMHGQECTKCWRGVVGGRVVVVVIVVGVVEGNGKK